MNETELRRRILEALRSVAPEVEPSEIQANVRLRDQIDIDSMDYLNFLIAIHQGLGVDIPETAYGKLATIDDIVAFVAGQRAEVAHGTV